MAHLQFNGAWAHQDATVSGFGLLAHLTYSYVGDGLAGHLARAPGCNPFNMCPLHLRSVATSHLLGLPTLGQHSTRVGVPQAEHRDKMQL